MKWLREIDRWFIDAVLPHEGALVALGRKLLGSSDAAHDLVQDVLIEVIADRKWQSIVNPRVYLMRMVYTRALSVLKRRKIVPFAPLPTFETLFFADAAPDAFAVVDGRQKVELVMAAIDELPPQCREAFMLCRVHGYSSEEAAAVLGISASSVRTHVARGLALITRRVGAIALNEVPPSADLRAVRVDRD